MSNQKRSINPIKLSKLLSLTLRHKAIDQGFLISDEGYINCHELLKSSIYKQYKFDDILSVVQNNDKNRFHLKRNPELDEIKDLNQSIPLDEIQYWFIKANQGHSIPIINLELTSIINHHDYPTVIHGTYLDKWNLIKLNGLNKMKRNHIHFAIGLPGNDEVISGMRKSCDIFIYINLEKALKDNIPFFISTNRVVLSSGLKDTGAIPKEYFEKVTDKRGGLISME